MLGVMADSYNAPAVGGGLPVAGVRAWYDASDASSFTYSSSTIVSQWNDKSGNNLHFTQGTVSTQPNRNGTQKGLTTLVFDGVDDSLIRATPMSTVIDNFTMFAVYKRTGGAANEGTFFASGSTGNGWAMSARAYNLQNPGFLMGGINWHSYGFGDNTSSPWVVQTLRKTAGVWSGYLSSKTVTAFTPAPGATTHVPTAASICNATHKFGGEIAELIFYDTVISDTDRGKIETYLYSKWILSSPTNIAGCIGWWDASDTASITSSGGAVSQWNDKSSQGKHVTQATAGAKPTTGTATVNGRNVLVFDGGDYLNYAGTTGLDVSNATVFVAFRELVAENYAGILSIHPSTGSDNASANGLNINTSDGTYIAATDRNNANSYFTGSGLAAFGTFSARFTSSTGNIEVWRNGVAGTIWSSGVGPPYGVADGGWLFGGRYQSGVISSSYRLNGQIAEVIVYNTALSVTDRTAVENYLQYKWITGPPA